MLLLVGSSLVAAPANAAPLTTSSTHRLDPTGWDPLPAVEKLGNLAVPAASNGRQNLSSSSEGTTNTASGSDLPELTFTPVAENGAQPVSKYSNGHPATV